MADLFIRSADDITKDVGQELKDTAKRIYTVGIFMYKFLLVLELIALCLGCIGLIIDDFVNILSAILLFAAYLVAAVIQYYLIVSVLYRVTIEMYARGENVHYLRKISEQGVAKEIKSADAQKTQNSAKASKNTAPVLESDSWLCKSCGTQNKKQYGQCKKCGTYRTSETSIEEEMPKTPATPAVAAPAPHLADTWECGYCGTSNSMKYGQCKKCGKLKNS